MVRVRGGRFSRRSILAMLGGGAIAAIAAACGGAAPPTAVPAAKPGSEGTPAPKPAATQGVPAAPVGGAATAGASPSAAAKPADATKPAAAAEAKPQPATPTPFVPPKRSTPAPGQTVISFWYHWGGVIGQGMDAVSRAYEKVNPKVKVDSFSVGTSNAAARVLTALAGGDAPDTFNNKEVQALALRGATIPLDEYVTSSQVIKKADHYDAVWAGGQWEGKLYGVPAFENGAELGLIWNKDLFKAAGLDPDKPPKTFAEILTAHEKLTKFDSAGNLDVLGFDPLDGGATYLGLWANMLGVDWHDLKTNTIKLTQDEMVQAVDWIGNLYKKIGATKFGAFRRDFGTWGTINPAGSFAKRKQAMIIDGYWAAGGMAKLMPDANVGVTWAPARPDGRKVQRLGKFYAPITRDSKARDETWKFIEFVSSPDGLKILYDVGGVLLFSKPYLKKVDVKRYEAQGLDWFIRSPEEAANVYATSFSPVNEEALTRWRAAVDEVIFGRATAKDAMAAVEKQVQTELNDILRR